VFEHTHTQGRGAGLDVQVNRCVEAYVCLSIPTHREEVQV